MKGGRKMCFFFNEKLSISRKLWEIRRKLLLITIRKWHRPCQIKWRSLTLNDLKGRYALLWLNNARYGMLLLITDRKSIWFSNDMKIIDLGWPWRSLTTSTIRYPSDSWASCCHFPRVWFAICRRGRTIDRQKIPEFESSKNRVP